MDEIKYKIKNKLHVATQTFVCPSSNNDLLVYCDRFLKNIDQSTKIFKLIFFALFAHPNVPHKMCLIKLMYILCDHFTDLMLNDCRKRVSLSASNLALHMIVYLLYYHQIGSCPASLYPICIRSEALQGYSSYMYKRCQLSLRASLRSTRRMRGRLTGQTQSRTMAWPL